jgi:hypothetical protein
LQYCDGTLHVEVCAQVPQFAATFRLVSHPSLLVCEQSPKPGLQAMTQLPFGHEGVPLLIEHAGWLAHVVPQELARCRLVSQPSVTPPLQSA